MATVKRLFFQSEEELLLCSYGSDTYTLWKDVVDYQQNGYEPDVFSIVKERLHKRGDYSLDQYYSHQIESVFLFFDYDPQNRTIASDRLNRAVGEMIGMFSDSMDMGQIYISYPMIEAIYCENDSDDGSYASYCVPINACGNKDWCNVYAYARKRTDVIFRTNKNFEIKENIAEDRVTDLRSCWNNLIKSNAIKANYISNGGCCLPENVSDIDQGRIFNGQLQNYVTPNSSVSILSSIAMFLYEYFHGNGDF